MIKLRKRNLSLVILLIAALFAAILHGTLTTKRGIDNVIAIQAATGGDTAILRNSKDKISVELIDSDGFIKKSAKIPMKQGGGIVNVHEVAIDEKNVIYIIKDICDAYTGKRLFQELECYDMSGLYARKICTNTLSDNIVYQWIETSDSALTLIGTNSDNIVRETYEYGMAQSRGKIKPKSVRNYPINNKDGVYRAVNYGEKLLYIAKSGKVFEADEKTETELYPARGLTQVMYSLYMTNTQADGIIIGEQESGDMVTLNPTDKTTSVLKTGTEPFAGVSIYSPRDVLEMSMIDSQNFTAVVRNRQSGFYELLVSEKGTVSLLSNIRQNIGALLLRYFLLLLFYVIVATAIWGLVRLFIFIIRNSRTILLKLVFSTIPLLLCSLSLFGVFSYMEYQSSINQSFQKQVVDEGNMLTALFGTESFDEIEFPYDYKNEAYSYLINQMNTRTTFTRAAYYERNTLFTGVDKFAPCFYPFGINMNKDLQELYEKAAIMGKSVTGIIDDQYGKRVSCITPMGGVTGDSIYLLETGIYTANLDKYMTSYIRNYVITMIAFIAVISFVILWGFVKILKPLGGIKTGFEEFSKGNRSVRLNSTTNDELSDISRVFNKMANDIDTQFYNLKKVSDTYYRFVPQRIFKLLNKENLAEIQLGVSVEGVYNILCVNLFLKEDTLTFAESQKLINQFFNVINTIANQNNATLVSDSLNLRSTKVICQSGAESAITIALSVMAQLDGINAALPVNSKMDAVFLLHKTEIYYGICGDEERYIPAMLSQELDYLATKSTEFRRLNSRLIVTAPAYEELQSQGEYGNRFIGYLEDTASQEFGLFDFYDSKTPELTRVFTETKPTFDKAIALFLEKRYYEAKNLFAIVLRENQFDNVARYYVFECESHLKNEK